LGASEPATPNLDFGSGTFSGWEGNGFALVTTSGKESHRAYLVTSRETTTSCLRRVLDLPASAHVIRFTGQAIRGEGCPENAKLDVLLLENDGRPIAKQVRTVKGWLTAPTLLPGLNGQAREYIWPVAAYAGQRVQLLLVDQDDRPGCYLECGSFQIMTQDEFEGYEFSRCMVILAREHKLFPMMRYDTRHFTVLSNADERFSEARLRDCELMYSLFYDHFRRKGFGLRPPKSKLMVAMFDSQRGFEAYMGGRMPASITGIYHPASNRFVMYDYGQNESLIEAKRQAEQNSHQISSHADRVRYLESVYRQAKDFRLDANTTTIMHEVAHQLSFNCDLLKREADVPAWLAEGLACYCEATGNGAWQGLGEVNPQRLAILAAVIRGNDSLLPLRELLEDDRWVRARKNNKKVLVGYAESWALFRMLMEEQSRGLSKFLGLIHGRQNRERRLADFEQAFGVTPSRMERRFLTYVKEQVQLHLPIRP
jgi:hypothetical protein